MSPSPGVCTGEIARAYPSAAICAILLACTFVSRAFVATTPMVVFSPGRPVDWRGAPARSSLRASARCCPSSVRVPATTCPVSGSMMSPTALTATIAATTSPFGSLIAADPMPAFIGFPPDLPTVAPAPAPTLPSSTGASEAASAAR